MKIVADENIACLHDTFGTLGELLTRPGRSLAANDVESADALIVRSVTRVDETLLAGSRVRFVGSCTIGTDHIDLDYLARAGIRFAYAPGCNARAVAEYVIAALFQLLGDLPCWRTSRVGIAGYGNVGQRLAQLLDRLGVEWVVYDPLVPQSSAHFVGFYDILQCEIITLHVPLTTQGNYPTHHWFDLAVLQKLAPHTTLINASRGAVICNSSLSRMLANRALATESVLQVVLDVFENEPAIDVGLLSQIALATPHIAGYSVQGKERGTWQVFEQLCSHLARATPVPVAQMPVDLDCRGCGNVRDVILKAYDIASDDRSLRSGVDGERAVGDMARNFDALRKHYPSRHEWTNLRLRNIAQTALDQTQIQQLRMLGFVV